MGARWGRNVQALLSDGSPKCTEAWLPWAAAAFEPQLFKVPLLLQRAALNVLAFVYANSEISTCFSRFVLFRVGECELNVNLERLNLRFVVLGVSKLFL